MPAVRQISKFKVLWDWRAEFCLATLDIRTTIQIIVAHPLRDVLQMALVGLKRTVHHSTLKQEVRQSSHIERIEQIYFEEKLISHMVSIKRNTFHQSDMRNKGWFFANIVITVAHCQRMINR